MGRKRKLKPSMKPDQLKKLADRLVGTRLNIYATAAELFRVAVVDDDFDALKECGILRCEECCRWITTEEESEVSKCCCECYVVIEERLKS